MSRANNYPRFSSWVMGTRRETKRDSYTLLRAMNKECSCPLWLIRSVILLPTVSSVLMAIDFVDQ